MAETDGYSGLSQVEKTYVLACAATNPTALDEATAFTSDTMT